MDLPLRNRLRAEFPTVTSERLRLRRIEEKDSDKLFACVTDPLVRRHTSFQKGTLTFPARLFRYFDDTYQSLRDLHFAVELKETEDMIGVCSLQFWAPDNGTARLGYLLSPDYWNKGLATEAARAILDFGFETLELEQIEARCSINNPASAQVLRKCGFTLSGNGKVAVQGPRNNGTGDLLEIYNLSRQDARKVQARICYTNEIYL